MAKVFAAIPKGVTLLDLTFNGLGSINAEELATVFSAIPKGITSLDFSGNGLKTKTADELANAFSAIPKGVTFLDLRDIDNINAKELAKVFAAIPKSFSSLSIRSNDRHQLSSEEKNKIWDLLPNVTSISFKDKAEHRPVSKSMDISMQAGVVVASILTGVGLFAAGTNKQETTIEPSSDLGELESNVP